MRIYHIELTNFKNYSHAAIDFSPGVNLFVGSNGSGKTGLLEAINVAVGGFFGSQEQKLQRGIRAEEVKLTKGIREEYSAVFASSQTPVLQWQRTRGKKTITFLNLNRKLVSSPNLGIESVKNYGAIFFAAFNTPEDRTIAPLIAYYSSQRLFIDAAQSKKQKYDATAGRRNGYLQCLDENAIKPVLDEWLGNAVTRRATKQIKEIDGIDLILENVEEAIRSMLIDFQKLPQDFPLKIYQDPDHDNELFINFDNEHDLPLSYYSDGFRNLIYLVIDLVWRASQLNPWLELKHISEKVTGVVTIDEIDLHLHPKWQAKAIGFIKDIFPNVQFFITTHSPTVVANYDCRIDTDTLFAIDNSEVNKVHEKFFGKQVDSILRDILGATDRHVPTQEKIDSLLRKIDNEAPEEEISSLLSELKELLGTDDADVERAQTLMDWKKIEKADSDAIHP
ncbi:MAG: AAA family ATPase [Taibaiella sp.]|nr:AAA family ATPase [Taibaiella sp.]